MIGVAKPADGRIQTTMHLRGGTVSVKAVFVLRENNTTLSDADPCIPFDRLSVMYKIWI